MVGAHAWSRHIVSPLVMVYPRHLVVSFDARQK